MAVTDIGCGVVTQISHLRAIADHVAAIRQIARRAGVLPREDMIALERRCKLVADLLYSYLQLRLPFSPNCPTCGQALANRRY